MTLIAKRHETRSKAVHLRVEQSLYSEDMKHRLQRIGSPARWVADKSAWDYPLLPSTVIALAKVAQETGETIEWQDGLQEYADAHIKQSDSEHQVRLAIERIIRDKPPLPEYVTRRVKENGEPIEPLYHQQVDYHWSQRVGGLLLAEDPGCGKSRSAADASGGWYRNSLIRPMTPAVHDGSWGVEGGVLVVCPKIVMKTWQNELTQWQNASSLVIKGAPTRKKRLAATPSHYHLINYESLKFVEKNHYDGIILDECFVAGTPVWTETGMRPIESLRVGDKVITRTDAGKFVLKTVAHCFKNTPKGSVVRVKAHSHYGPIETWKTSKDGTLDMCEQYEEIVCTENHPFSVQGYPSGLGVDVSWASPSQWLGGKAQAVSFGAVLGYLQTSSDSAPTHLTCLTLEGEGVAPDGFVYNLEVEDTHTYFVGHGGHLVHNCHRCANHTNQTEYALTIASRAKKRLGLSGTPIANSLESIFYPMLILDGGKSLGASKTAFLEKFFTKQQFGQFHKNIPNSGAAEAIAAAMAESTHFVTKAEVLPFLPKKTHTPIYLEMTAEQEKYYQQVKKDALVYIQDAEVNLEQASARMMKLLQVCQGFVLADVGGRHFTNAKTDALFDMLTDTLRGRKVIVWCFFKYEIEQIVLGLKARGIKHVHVDGNVTSQRQRDADLHAWNHDPDLHVFVRQLGMSEGVTMIANESGNPCYDNIYCGLSYKYIEWKQSQDRIHRIGQEIPCSYTYLLTENGVDRSVYESVLQKNEVATFVHERGKDFYLELLRAS